MAIPLEKLPPHVRRDIEQYINLREQLRQLRLRMQQFENELETINNALDEISKLDEKAAIYKSVGAFLIKTDKNKAIEELKEKKEILELRVQTLKRQVNLLNQQIKNLEKKIRETLSQMSLSGES